MQSRLLVYPANQASCEVPVLPAAGASKAALPDGEAGAVVDDVLHHVGDHVGHARVQHRAPVGVEVLDHVAVGRADGVDAAIGSMRVPLLASTV